MEFCRPVVFTGPSGVGKSTLIQAMQAACPDTFGFSVSHTTRGPRPGEVDGKDYHYSSREIMEPMIAAGKFIEHANVHGNLYGTSFEAVNSVRESCRICVLDIDVQGARNCRAVKLDATYIFIDPPTEAELERRLRSRGTETEERILLRLANSKGEILAGKEPGLFDHHIIHDDSAVATQQLLDILKPQLEGFAACAAESRQASTSSA